MIRTKRNRTFNSVIPAFIAEKAITLSRRTVQGYIGSLTMFSLWLDSHGYSLLSFKEIDRQIMYDFFVYLATFRKLDRPTCEKYFLRLRSIFRYAKKRKYIKKLPFKLIVFPQKGKDCSAAVIPLLDLRLLLRQIRGTDKQLFLACMIIFYCFIRPGTELRLMKIKDIDFVNGVIKIPQDIAKNRISESVTIPIQLMLLFEKYELDKMDRSFYVFGKKRVPGLVPLSQNMLRYRFNKIRDRLDLSKSYKLYSMKHTGATMLHESGVSMRALMDQLRHKRLEATQHYVKKHAGIVDEKIRDKFPNPLIMKMIA